MRASIIVAVFAIIYGFIVSHSPPAPDPGRPAVTATATEIFTDFRNNVIDAEAEYAGSNLQITGEIGRIRQTITGVPTIEFHSTDGQTIRCEFDNDGRLSGLRAGQQVTVSGHCRGTTFDLILDNCTVSR